MARPKKGQEKGASTHLGLRITPELREALDVVAKRHGRSVSDEGRIALEHYVQRHSNAPLKAAADVPAVKAAKVRKVDKAATRK